MPSFDKRQAATHIEQVENGAFISPDIDQFSAAPHDRHP
jgi:hypothetical protein